MLTSFTHLAVSWPAVGLLALTMVGVVLVTHLVRLWLFDTRGGKAGKARPAARPRARTAERRPAGGRKKSGRK